MKSVLEKAAKLMFEINFLRLGMSGEHTEKFQFLPKDAGVQECPMMAICCLTGSFLCIRRSSVNNEAGLKRFLVEEISR